MAKFSYIVNNLSFGEVHPRTYGRTDVEVYKKGCKKLENAIPYVQGGAGRRPGSQFVASHYYVSGPATYTAFSSPPILIPFVRTRGLSNPQPEMLVFTGGTGIVPNSSSTDTSIYSFRTTVDLQQSTSSVPNANATFIDVKWIETYSGVGSFSSAYPDWGAPSTSSLPYQQWAQAGDTMIIVRSDGIPLFITSIDQAASAGVPTFVAYPFYAVPKFVRDPLISTRFIVDSASISTNAFPFRDINTNSSHTLSFSGTTGSVTVTSSKDFFSSTHVGAIFKLNGGGYFIITGFTSKTSVTAEVITTLGSAAATADWFEGAWSDYRGWPRTVAYHEGRLIYGGNRSQPDTLWFSELNDIHELEEKTSPTASDAFNLTIDSSDGAAIVWLSSGKNLNIGTETAEWILNSDAGLSVTDFSFSKESASGSWPVPAVRNGNAVTFVEKDGRTFREFVFNFQEDSFRSDSLSLYNNHLIERMHKLVGETDPMPRFQTRALALQGGEFPTLWACDNWGGLWAISRDRTTGTTAGHFHKIGGSAGSDPAKVWWVASAPGPWFGWDDVYIVVQRTINNSTVYYIEKIGEPYRYDNVFTLDRSYSSNQVGYSDGFVTVIDTASTSIPGFWHLRGQTVDVVADGKYIGQKTVGTDSSGTITLTNAAEVVVAGLPYTTIIEPLPVEAGSVIGSGLYQIKRIHGVVIKFIRAVFCSFGRDEDNQDELVFRPNDINMGDPTPFYSGVQDKELNSIYGTEGSVVITTDKPFPMDISSISLKGTTYD